MKTLLLCALCALCISLVHAEPIKLTNKQADELLGTLAQIQPGLTAANTTKVARNINALRAVVEAYVKGNQSARERHKVTRNTKDEEPNATAFLAEIQRNSSETVTVELARLGFADDEIRDAKIAPATLAAVLLYLDASASAPEKPKK